MAEVTVSKCNQEEEELVVNMVQIDDDAAAVTVTGNNKIAAAQQQQQQQLEGKKKRLLEELESAFTIATPKLNSSLGFSNIEVIDETALLDCIPINNGKPRRKPSKKINKNNTVAPPRTIGTDKKKYSREMMESMRFVNVSQQLKFWKTIYTALQSAFADEYDTLVVAATAHNNRPFLPNKKPILTGVGAANGRCRYVNVFVH